MVVFDHITMYIEDNFKKDLEWLLSELKQEEMANAYSGDQIKFPFRYSNENNGPSIRSLHRLFKMLEDRRAIKMRPFFHGFMTAFDGVFQMQGADPLGYYVTVHQPQFDEVIEEVTNGKPLPIVTQSKEEQESTANSETLSDTPKNTYFITVSTSRKVLLNNTFILSTPNFVSENHQFIEYVIAHPDQVLTKADFESENVKLKKTMHSILGDLGFKGQVRKMFFEVSKNKIKFRNYVPETELKALEVNVAELNAELSALERYGQKEEETMPSSEK